MSVSAVSAIQPSVLPDSLVPTLASENATTATAAFGQSHLHMFAADDDSPSFGDFLDVINPLQHIPVVNDIYRELTGDNKIGVAARLAGGALFGGVFGLIGSAVNAVVEEATGHDIGGNVLALFKDDAPSSSGTALASATAPNPTAETAPAAAPSGTGKDDGDKTTAKAMPLPDLTGAPPSLTPAAVAPAAVAAAAPTPLTPAAVAAAAPDSPKVAADTTRTVADATIPPAPAAAPQASVTAVEGKPMPVWGSREPRMMPVPPRTTPLATKSPPALGMAVSSSTARSNSPVTGARIQMPPSPALVQEVAAAPPSVPQPGTAASGEWFSSAMIDGLAKYERNAKLSQASRQSVSESQ